MYVQITGKRLIKVMILPSLLIRLQNICSKKVAHSDLLYMSIFAYSFYKQICHRKLDYIKNRIYSFKLDMPACISAELFLFEPSPISRNDALRPSVYHGLLEKHHELRAYQPEQALFQK